MDGKKKIIGTYLSEIQTSVEMLDDASLLDHTTAKLLPIVTSLRAHLTQPSDEDEALEEFDATEKFPPAQKNEVQLKFCKVKTPGRKKGKPLFT